MSNPTKEIRAKLDELGIAWYAINETTTEYTQEGIVYMAYEFCDGLQVVIVTPVAPEQAVAATVGTGTCKCVDVTPNDWDEDLTMYHMECGFTMLYGEDRPQFCGGCGRRIEVSE